MERTLSPLGSAARTNQLLGGNYFDPTSGRQLQSFNPATGRALQSPPDIGGPAQYQATPQNGNAYDTSAIIALLRRAQQQGTQTINQAQLEQTDRGSAPLPADLANMNLSPADQLGFRRGEVNAVEPTIGGARKLVDEVKSAVQEIKDMEEKSQQKAQYAIERAIAAGPEALDGLLKENPEVFKKAGQNPKDFEIVLRGLKAKQAREQEQFNIIHNGGTSNNLLGGDNTGSSSSQGVATNDPQKLEYSRGADGYVDPTIYLNLYKAWIAKGGDLEKFLTAYPPQNYVNPKNDWLPPFLKPKANTGTIDFSDIPSQ